MPGLPTKEGNESIFQFLACAKEILNRNSLIIGFFFPKKKREQRKPDGIVDVTKCVGKKIETTSCSVAKAGENVAFMLFFSVKKF